MEKELISNYDDRYLTISNDRDGDGVLVVETNKATGSGVALWLSTYETKQIHAWLTDQLGLGWISVDDDLPEKANDIYSNPVLVYSSKTGLFYAALFDAMSRKWIIECDCNAISYAENVTHWMPLPQPPDAK